MGISSKDQKYVRHHCKNQKFPVQQAHNVEYFASMSKPNFNVDSTLFQHGVPAGLPVLNKLSMKAKGIGGTRLCVFEVFIFRVHVHSFIDIYMFCGS
jgi:hypothetical protein